MSDDNWESMLTVAVFIIVAAAAVGGMYAMFHLLITMYSHSIYFWPS